MADVTFEENLPVAGQVFLTLQQIFDKALFGVRAQGRPSAVDGVCKYRGPDGTKCGVGHLIPDNVYDERFDSGYYSVNSLIVRSAEFRDALEAGGVNWRDHKVEVLLTGLQRAHDNAERRYYAFGEPFLEAYNFRMRELAEIRGLVYTEPGVQA